MQVAAGRLKDPDKIGVKVGKVINKRKVGKHFITDIADGRFAMPFRRACSLLAIFGWLSRWIRLFQSRIVIMAR